MVFSFILTSCLFSPVIITNLLIFYYGVILALLSFFVNQNRARFFDTPFAILYKNKNSVHNHAPVKTARA